MIQQKCAELFNYTSQAFEPVSIAVLFVFEHRRLEEFVGVGVADSGGACAPPFCVVQRLSTPNWRFTQVYK